MPRSALSLRLRAATAEVHEDLEAALALLEPGLTVPALCRVLRGFAAFWSGTEPLIDAWARRRPGLATELEWPRRRRSTANRRDLAALGDRTPVTPGEPVFAVVDDAEVFGWLYVSEGSTLGGAALDRGLRARFGRLASFTPYAEGPAPMWRAYLSCLDTWAGRDPARADAVVDAAVTTFGALHASLLPRPSVPA